MNDNAYIMQVVDRLDNFCKKYCSKGCETCAIREKCREFTNQTSGGRFDYTPERMKIAEEVDSALDKIMLKKSETECSKVNHPIHYNTGSIECIDAMVETQGKEAVMAFCVCNAMKYIWRHNSKNGVEDVRKAKWYIDKYLELYDEKPVEVPETVSESYIPDLPQ